MGFLFKNKKKTENGMNDFDEILGYFDEVIKQRKEIEIKIKKKTFSCGVFQLDDKKKSMRIQDKDMEGYDKETAKCGVSLDSTWFSFNSIFLIIDQKPYLMLPEELVHSERRKNKRVSFTKRENTQASILESFGKGTGITGSIQNISLTGLCVEIERVVSLESGKEIRPQLNILEKGQKLGLVRLKGIPNVPEVDITGTVNEIRSGHIWKISIELPKFDDKIQASLERFIGSRSRTFTLIRRSRKKRIEAEKQMEKEAKFREKDQLNNSSTPENFNQRSTIIEQVEIEKKNIFEEEKLKLEEERKKNLIPILIVGKPLDRDLFFLRKFSNFEFFIAEDIPDLLKNLSEHSPDLLFIPHSLKDQNMINILLKISQKGVLRDIRVFLFIETIISENEVLKCKALGIEGILTLPIKDPLVLIKKISKKT